MAEKEVVLELGVEGGGATISRTRLSNGEWQFHVEGSSMFLDDNDDETWRSWQAEPVANLMAAIQSIGEGDSWVWYMPIRVLPDYRHAVWEAAQQLACELPERLRRLWMDRKAEWQSHSLGATDWAPGQ
jgi:hypothetical protein